MPLTTIIWDWNGTLADDVGVALQSVNDILARRGREPITLSDYYSYIDTPIRRFYEHLFSPLDDALFDQILVEFNEGYRLHMKDTGLMTGGKETLERFQKAGLRQFIISSSHVGELLHFCKLFGVEGYFQRILGAEDYAASGKVEMACRFLQEQRIAGEECVVIGDTLHDWEMARAIGCPVCLLDRGHQGRKELEESGQPVFHQLEKVADFLFSGNFCKKYEKTVDRTGK